MPGINSEKLFAPGYVVCSLGAMKAVAEQLKLKFPAETRVTATVGIGPRSEGGFGITADLTIALPGPDETAAQMIVDAANQLCPYSNATRGNVDGGLTVT